MALQFVYTKQDFVTDVRRSSDNSSAMAPAPTKFDTILQAGWTDRMERGLFCYSLTDVETRILPGARGFVFQLNIQRGTARRKPQEIQSIHQEFNARQFNFNKIRPEEVLFEMMQDTERDSVWCHSGQSDEPWRMVALINVSPLEFGHCLFVPSPSRCLPQILNRFTIEVGIESVLLSSNPGFRVGFNSLGAFASVNHLHMHGYYLEHELKIESMPAKPLLPEKGFHRLLDFPTGFLFYAEAEDVEKVATAISEVTDFLVTGNIAHNLVMTRGCPPCDLARNDEDPCSRRGVRIVVWPRKSSFGAKEPSALTIAFCELTGHVPFKNKRDYEITTEEDIVDTIQEHLLPDEEFHKLEQQLTHRLM